MSHAHHCFWNCYKPSCFSTHFWQGAEFLVLATQNDIRTSKSALYLAVFLHFCLRNVLRATTACTFSTCQLPKWSEKWCVLYILTWKCASRQNGVQFLISHLARLLRTRRFSEPTVRPTGATNHWKKHSVSRLSYPFAPGSSFFWLSLLWPSFFFLLSSFFFPLSSLLFSSLSLSLSPSPSSLSPSPSPSPSPLFSSLLFSSLLFSPSSLLFSSLLSSPIVSSRLFSSLLFSSLLFSSLLFSSLLFSSLLFSSLLFICPYCRKFDF